MARILKEIWIYPVKGFGGIRMANATADEKGFQHDRRWMLVDENNRFLTQRELPQLALCRLTVADEGFRMHIKDDYLSFPKATQEGEALNAVVWGDQVVVMEWNPKASRWISQQLGFNCRLVYFPESKPRRVDPDYVSEDLNVSLADGYPYLVIGESSLADLNQRLKDPVSMMRFRPNLVFTGGQPFEEDTWRDLVIGSVKFRGVKPCGRCVVTTNDKGRLGKEPLATLAKYRKVGDTVCFGMNLVNFGGGVVREGDEIEIETFAQPSGFTLSN